MFNIEDFNRIQTVVIDGRTWTVGKLTRLVLFAYRDWIKEQIGDPFEDIDRVKKWLTPEALIVRVKEAESTVRDLRNFSLATETSKRFGNENGMAKLTQLRLLKVHTDATEEDGHAILMYDLDLKKEAAKDTATPKPPVSGNAEAQPMAASTGQN